MKDRCTEMSRYRFSPLRVRPTGLVVSLSLLWTVLLTGQHLPVGEATDTFLYGQLRVEDRGVLPDFAALEAICAGQAYLIGFSSVDGRFALLLREGGPRLFTGLGVGDFSRAALAACELRVSLPGYRSGRVSLRATSLRSIVGPIALTRVGDATAKGPPDEPVGRDAVKPYRRGADALGNSRWTKAAEAFEKAIALSPAYSRAWTGLGMAREGAHQWEQALACFAKSVSLTPNYPVPYVRMASTAVRLERWQQAAQYSEAVLGLNPALPEAYALCALANLKLNRLDITGSSARQGLRVDPDHDYPELHLLLAQALAGLGKYEECARHLEQYLALVPNDANASRIQAQLSDIRAKAAARSGQHP